MAHIEPTMFREYDIRGKANDSELNPVSGELIGKGYGTFLKKRGVENVVVAYDSRLGSKPVKEGFVQGVLSTGRNVIDIGLALTPMMYWAQYHFKVKGGAMITGSHNPKDWTGFKLACGFSYTLIGNEIKEILAYIKRDDFAVEDEGSVREETITDAFIADLAGRIGTACLAKICDDLIDADGNVLAHALAALVRQHCLELGEPLGNCLQR